MNQVGGLRIYKKQKLQQKNNDNIKKWEFLSKEGYMDRFNKQLRKCKQIFLM